METVHLSAISSSVGTISIILVYIYLYILYRERYMGIWATSWLILLSRYLIFDSGLLPWRQSILGLTVYQGLILVSILMFVWGTYIFIDKPFNKWWLYATAFITIISTTLNILLSSLSLKLFLPIYFGCFIGLWLGYIFISQVKVPGIGHIITGCAYILWSLLNLTAPFTIGGIQFLPLAYSLGGILRLIIAVGTLMVHFEKTRIDLIKKETQYRLLAENAIDVIYHYQLYPHRKLEYISPSVLPVTGYTPEDHYANNLLIFDLIHPDDHSLSRNFVDHFPHSITLPLTLRLICKNKAILWVEQKCSPIFDDKGQLIALEGIIRDITARKKLEQMSSLFDRMNMVGSMAATVAHEIRNPLTTVRGYLQVLASKEKYRTDREKFDLMTEEIDRANSIIKEYLSLSREKMVDLKKYSLNRIIDALFPLIQADATASKVNVFLKQSEIPDLLLDENEIRQLLLNLVRNGIEAMPTGGNLTLRTFLEDNHAVLSISDQGSGIPSHILDNLGTPFVTTKDSGTGLGLPICYQIAHRHHANIQIDTGAQGTTISVYFAL